MSRRILTGEDTRACILAGPVLDDKDPSKDFGFGKIKYPLQFWKVIAVPTAQDGTRKLTVFGFVLSQRDVVKEFGIEVFRPGRFKKYQTSLAKITEMTGVQFHVRLHDADVMAGETDNVPHSGQPGGSRGSGRTLVTTAPTKGFLPIGGSAPPQMTLPEGPRKPRV